jgi:hypothetical protein
MRSPDHDRRGTRIDIAGKKMSDPESKEGKFDKAAKAVVLMVGIALGLWYIVNNSGSVGYNRNSIIAANPDKSSPWEYITSNDPMTDTQIISAERDYEWANGKVHVKIACSDNNNLRYALSAYDIFGNGVSLTSREGSNGLDQEVEIIDYDIRLDDGPVESTISINHKYSNEIVAEGSVKDLLSDDFTNSKDFKAVLALRGYSQPVSVINLAAASTVRFSISAPDRNGVLLIDQTDNNVQKVFTSCGIQHSADVSDTSNVQQTGSVSKLKDRYVQLYVECRNQSGDDPSTAKSCAERDRLESELQERGWCFSGGWTGCQPNHATILDREPPDNVPNTAAFKSEDLPSDVVAPNFRGHHANYEPWKEEIYSSLKRDANFNGHYSVVTVGCGTGCRATIVVDRESGGITPFPISGEPFPLTELTYSADSGIIEAIWHETNGDGGACFRQDFQLVGSTFQGSGRFASRTCDVAWLKGFRRAPVRP